VASPPGGLSQETGLTKNAPGPSAPLSHPRFIAAVCHRFFASCGKHLAFSLNWNDSASFLLPALRHASTIVVNLVGGRRATGAHRLLAWQPCLAHLGRARLPGSKQTQILQRESLRPGSISTLLPSAKPPYL
jgi:hypothetical protein